MAICDSVTVSIAELRSGTFNSILDVSRVDVSTSAGVRELYAGWRRTSSNVSPSGITSGIMGCSSMVTSNHGDKPDSDPVASPPLY